MEIVFRKFFQLEKILIFLINLSLIEKILANQDLKIVCYFTNWAVQRPGMGSMIPEHMDPCLCTHIIYGFSEMKDNKLSPMEKYDHVDGDKPGFFERINNLKQKNPHLRTLLAVGGWEMGMGAFSAMVKDEKNMVKFVKTSIEYLKKWNFDGLDLDFEYPGIDWRGSDPTDKMAFTKLCKMLREAFQKESESTGKERLLLTAAVAGARNTIDKAYEVDKVSEYLDWWNLMTYDLHGPWDTNAGHHSAIHGKDSQDYLYIDFIVKYYESKGAPRNKLMLGLANYGRSDAPAMPYTGFKGESGFLSYYESCIMLACESWKEFWNDAQLVPYAKGKENYPWAGYDNVKSMKIKAEYILKEKLAGAMFWAADLDDFTGKFCCQGFFPLIRTVKSVLENEPKFMPPSNICSACPTQEYKTLKKKVKKKRSVDDVCKEKGEGVHPDPTDCTKYFTCRSMSTAWAEKKQETCYTGSYFDKAGGQCKWVGVGNYKCEDILEKTDGDKKDDVERDTESKSEKEPNDEKDGNSEKDDTDVKNRQKIFYEVHASKQLADTIIPPNLYTCSADLNAPNDGSSSGDFIKCFSCDANSNLKNIPKCKSKPSTDTTNVISCNSKTQKCFSKSLFNVSNKNELIAFSRGCASLKDLESTASNEKNDASESADSDSGEESTKRCIQRTNTTKICFVVCNSHLCNNVEEIKANGGFMLNGSKTNRKHIKRKKVKNSKKCQTKKRRTTVAAVHKQKINSKIKKKKKGFKKNQKNKSKANNAVSKKKNDFFE